MSVLAAILFFGYVFGAMASAFFGTYLCIERNVKAETAATVGIVAAIFGPLTLMVAVMLGSYMLFRVLRTGIKDLWSMRPWREKIPKARVL